MTAQPEFITEINGTKWYDARNAKEINLAGLEIGSVYVCEKFLHQEQLTAYMVTETHLRGIDDRPDLQEQYGQVVDMLRILDGPTIVYDTIEQATNQNWELLKNGQYRYTHNIAKKQSTEKARQIKDDFDGDITHVPAEF